MSKKASHASSPPPAAGYSKNPLVKKLGLRQDDRAVFVNEPKNFRTLLGPLPPGVTVTSQLRGSKEFIHIFATDESFLQRKLKSAVGVLEVDGMLWLSWPKKSSGMATVLDGGLIRRAGLDAGLVDVKVCAVDETWSGHKFVFRKEDRDRISEERSS